MKESGSCERDRTCFERLQVRRGQLPLHAFDPFPGFTSKKCEWRVKRGSSKLTAIVSGSKLAVVRPYLGYEQVGHRSSSARSAAAATGWSAQWVVQ